MKRGFKVVSMLMLCFSMAVILGAASDYTLGVFGNANMDDQIDEQDIAFVQDVISGAKSATSLTDANYDGKIDEGDIEQIEQILNGTEKEITILDSANRTVTIKEPVNKIAVYGNEPADALRILGAEDKVIGVENNLEKKAFFPEYRNLSTIGGWDADYEALLSLKPDLVIAYAAQEIDDKKLPGITVLHFDFYKARNTFKEIKTLGVVLGKEKEAQEYIDFCDEIIDEVRGKVDSLPDDQRARVYIETADPYVTHTSNGATGYQIELAGGRNMAADLAGSATGWVEVDAEWVVKEDPQVIVKMAGWNRGNISSGYETSDTGDVQKVWDEIRNRPELAKIKAIQDNRVHVISFDVTYNPDFIISVAYMAKWFYPDLFRDMDPVAIHQEFIDKFHKQLKWNVTKEGVFVYPPLAS
ncbi:MAG: Cobalamin-binding protein precursor [Methanosaeta sp. PtaU1.Bin016]|jgi:iron complex transport system substrate-binding protein|nr:MAG: Cobalamin-binding protein precursor [Methanosaeta sp. PtaU1.Bin016]